MTVKFTEMEDRRWVYGGQRMDALVFSGGKKKVWRMLVAARQCELMPQNRTLKNR